MDRVEVLKLPKGNYFIYENNIFISRKVHKGRMYVECSIRSCNKKLILSGLNILKSSGFHSHINNIKDIVRKRFVCDATERVKTDKINTSISHIYKQEFAKAATSPEIEAHLPTYENVKTIMYRMRTTVHKPKENQDVSESNKKENGDSVTDLDELNDPKESNRKEADDLIAYITDIQSTTSTEKTADNSLVNHSKSNDLSKSVRNTDDQRTKLIEQAKNADISRAPSENLVQDKVPQLITPDKNTELQSFRNFLSEKLKSYNSQKMLGVQHAILQIIMKADCSAFETIPSNVMQLPNMQQTIPSVSMTNFNSYANNSHTIHHANTPQMFYQHMPYVYPANIPQSVAAENTPPSLQPTISSNQSNSLLSFKGCLQSSESFRQNESQSLDSSAFLNCTPIIEPNSVCSTFLQSYSSSSSTMPTLFNL